MFRKNGYVIKVLNLIDRTHSDAYNPLAYIHKAEDAYKLTNQIVKNTNPEGKMGAGQDPFWEKSEILLIYALILFMWMELDKETVNFKTLMKLISMADASESDESAKSELDEIFDDLTEKKGKEYLPVAIYRDFKKAAGKTAKSILISVAARMNPFRMPDVQDMTLTDTMELDQVGNRKTVVFILTSDSDQSFNFMASILYSQLFNELYFVADFGKMEWKDNKIDFRTPQSLYGKHQKLLRYLSLYEKSVADNKKFKLYERMKEIIEGCEKEFGLPYKVFPDWDAKTGEAEYIDSSGNIMSMREYIEEYAETMELCILRLKDRKGTLESYLRDYMEQDSVIQTFAGSEGNETVNRKLKECTERKELIEEHIAKEFGIIKERPEKKKRKHLHIWKSFCKKQNEEDFAKDAEKHFLSDINYVLNDLNSKVHEYGSRESFEIKIERIRRDKAACAKLQKTIADLGKRQNAEKDGLRKKIREFESRIHRIERLIEYEFGINDISKFRANGGSLPVHVRCILDEFANITPIPDFDKLIATMRSRNISASPILQNISQLKAMYEKEWETIAGNCDSFLFLGGKEPSTVEYLQKQLGKATIDKRSTSHSTGSHGNFTKSWDVLGRELLTVEEITTMDTQECILIIRGYFPFRSKKYNLVKHKRYPLLADDDSDPKNFIVENEIQTQEIADNVGKNEIMNDNGIFELEIEKEVDRMIEYIERSVPIGGDVSPELFSSENMIMQMDPLTIETIEKNIQEFFAEKLIQELDEGSLKLEELTEKDLFVVFDQMKEDLEKMEMEEQNSASSNLFDRSNLAVTGVGNKQVIA